MWLIIQAGAKEMSLVVFFFPLLNFPFLALEATTEIWLCRGRGGASWGALGLSPPGSGLRGNPIRIPGAASGRNHLWFGTV